MNRQDLGQGGWRYLEHWLHFDNNLLYLFFKVIHGRDVQSAGNWTLRINAFQHRLLTSFPLILGSRPIASDRSMNLFVEVAMKAGFRSGLKWGSVSIAKSGPNTAYIFCFSFLQLVDSQILLFYYSHSLLCDNVTTRGIGQDVRPCENGGLRYFTKSTHLRYPRRTRAWRAPTRTQPNHQTFSTISLRILTLPLNTAFKVSKNETS